MADWLFLCGVILTFLHAVSKGQETWADREGSSTSKVRNFRQQCVVKSRTPYLVHSFLSFCRIEASGNWRLNPQRGQFATLTGVINPISGGSIRAINNRVGTSKPLSTRKNADQTLPEHDERGVSVVEISGRHLEAKEVQMGG
jgi:hypothetical protein